MADHVKVVVYVPAAHARKLREHRIENIPEWVRILVRDSIEGMPEPTHPLPPDYAESAE